MTLVTREPARYIVEPSEPSALRIERLSVWYGRHQAIRDVSFTIPARRITAIIGPSGCGKSTLLRALNRMHDLTPEARVEGSVRWGEIDLYAPTTDPVWVRRHIGMIFQKPNPFPKSIFENVAFGLRVNGYRGDIAARVEEALRKAALWDEVKDKLQKNALTLSGGQQQRLCIARAIALEPQILLMDEPCSALDPVATMRIEDLMIELAHTYTIVIVTHNMQQASRVSHYTAFMLAGEDRTGELIEYAPTRELFLRPRDRRTEDYITGRIG
ncbi:phosphate ABC transporter ATP-binding protein PstB [Thermomicrobium sp. CFH 73360]|jgi:phosphate transport system ATP-binding protein|uniref:Phosphate ABC transporter ATP-binding protein n=1 Tax=Thermomicrobium roseum TaxID=500 RepID=A0A7C1FQ55_THERO|nr:phosphate ABC transporter ATP-binding protein PstB [Thermomicrobium sp. CFH 73360]MCM8746134.1 phosphate ABC transporter ATP-binding protein PstB [Thermomicrobium sp. CFH 73360]GBD20022.1 Phosphate import ATP-binding protein PstB 3 [bacterium HR28]